MEDELILTIEGGVATITLNRPRQLNALSNAMFARLLEMVPRIAADPDIGAFVLTGAGRAFCAGGDVTAMKERYSKPIDEARRSLRREMELSRILYEMPKPTIAMINGAAAGGGLALGLACDLRIAAASARFTTAFSKLGLPGDFGGSYFLSRLIGVPKALELYYTSETFDAAQAFAWGMLTKIVPDSDLHQTVGELARRLAGGPRIALGYIKQNLRAVERGTLSDILDLEAMRHTAAHETRDHDEAAAAFLEKRTPVFRGI